MSVPTPETESTQSSSGYADGLGRRVLGFDRETGGILEQLVLRPELSAFEHALADRIGIVAGLEDERFARPRLIARQDDRLVVISEYLAGRRLSDIIEAAAEHGIVAGLDAALGLLLELLPALARLHDAGLAHGALAPGRLMITAAGQIVLLDSIYAEALERLQLTRKRLWSEFRLAFPPTAGLARFDKPADLAHASMVAATLAVGRALQDKDYPEGISVLRQEIHEIASIRGSKSWADAVDKFFAATLPIAGRRTTPSADEAAIDLRKLVRKELGINTCRTALLEFFQQVETADVERAATDAATLDQRIAQAREEAAQRSRREANRKQWQDTGAERAAPGAESARAEPERAERQRADAARDEQARLEAERLERERAEQARAEREAADRERAARDRAEGERAEEARLEAERLEAERLERTRLEAERLERERLEHARVEAERIERERLEAERRERERLEAERLEQERIENARIEAERLERERIEAERRERERLEAERLERERIEQARLEAERIERERLEAERRERERLEAERLERERIEKARLEAERLERERLEAERRERERLEAERLERERIEKARLEAERLERERLEAERRERERLEAERLERERIEKARLEAERLERERLAAERRERERLEAERLERERIEKARLEAERIERERAEKARLEAERRERERLEAERIERERAEKARLEAEQLERERHEAERVAQEARDKAERLERERLDAARQAEQARLDAQRLEQQRAEGQQRERERVEAERLERERIARDHAEADRREAERLSADTAADPDEDEQRDEEEVTATKTGSGQGAPTRSGWLIPPNRAASFEPVAPSPSAPAPVARPYPIYVAPAEPAATWSSQRTQAEPPADDFLAPIAEARNTPPAPAAAATSSIPLIRLRDDNERTHTAVRAESRRDPVEMEVSGSVRFEPFQTSGDKREIPWKLIAAGVVLVAAAVAAWRGYTPSAAPVVDTVRKVLPTRPQTAELAPVGANVGRLVITTQPAGAKVTVDGKPAGETPLTVDGVKPGRHVIAIAAAEGSTRRTVRVEAGQVLTLDVPLYSGFAAISAPFVLTVSEGGKVLGTSENHILLGPGRHSLRLANKELGYSATENVEITSGEVTRVDLDPKGRANINAAPWAEVWIDGENAGETPLANVPIRLGVREIVFKNPQFPERKQTVTITATAPATISVDFIK